MRPLQIPFDEYLALEGVNHSAAKAAGVSLLNYRWVRDNPSPDSDSKRLGRVVHSAILEPSTYNASVMVLDGPKPSKASGPDWDAFQAGKAICQPERFPRRAGGLYDEWANPLKDDGYAILSPAMWDKCLAYQTYLHHVGRRQIIPKRDGEACDAMRDAVRGNAAAMRYLSLGRAELSIQWTEPTTGILCKSRIDFLSVVDGSWVLVDLKTTRSIIERDMSRAAATYCFHSQMAFYHDALVSLGIPIERVMMVVVCSAPPYDVAVLEVGESTLEGGREAYQGWLRKIRTGRQSGEWPGRYGEREEFLNVPEYAEGMDSDDIGFED
jgi:hypothetical protein